MTGLGVRIGGSTFVYEPPPGGFGARMYYDATAKRINGRIVFDHSKQGPPNHAHGGAVTTILDEAMGAAAWTVGLPVLAVNLNVNLMHAVPLETEIEVTGWIERIDGRKVYTAAKMRLPDGRVAANSTGLFIQVREFDGLSADAHPFRPLE